MKKRGKYIMTARAAGKNPVGRDGSGRSYIIYDSCDKCPLKVYIDLVCNDNPEALVVKGNPPQEVLLKVSDELIAEFAELSGDSHFGVANTLVRKMNMYRAHILVLLLCQRLLLLGEMEKAIHSLNEIGIRCSGDLAAVMSKISGAIREKKVRLKQEEERYKKISEGKKGEKLTPVYFTEQLVSLSKYAGFRLTTDITLCEYATYIKNMREYVEQLKRITNVSK